MDHLNEVLNRMHEIMYGKNYFEKNIINEIGFTKKLATNLLKNSFEVFDNIKLAYKFNQLDFSAAKIKLEKTIDNLSEVLSKEEIDNLKNIIKNETQNIENITSSLKNNLETYEKNLKINVQNITKLEKNLEKLKTEIDLNYAEILDNNFYGKNGTKEMPEEGSLAEQLEKIADKVNPRSKNFDLNIYEKYPTYDDFIEKISKIVNDLVDEQITEPNLKEYLKIHFKNKIKNFEPRSKINIKNMYDEMTPIRKELGDNQNVTYKNLGDINKKYDETIKILKQKIKDKGIESLSDSEIKFMDDIDKWVDGELIETDLKESYKNIKQKNESTTLQTPTLMEEPKGTVEKKLRDILNNFPDLKKQYQNFITEVLNFGTTKTTTIEDVFTMAGITDRSLIDEITNFINGKNENLLKNVENGNYKYVVDENGNWSQLNMLNTNRGDNTRLLYNILKSKGLDVNYITPKDIENLINDLKTVDKTEYFNFFKKNEEFLTKKSTISTSVGDKLESEMKQKLKESGFEIVYDSSISKGNPIDKILGIDLIVRDSGGNLKGVQIKSVSKIKITESSIFEGEYALNFFIPSELKNFQDLVAVMDNESKYIIYGPQVQFSKINGEFKPKEVKGFGKGGWSFVDVTGDGIGDFYTNISFNDIIKQWGN